MSIRHCIAAALLLSVPAYAEAPKIVEDAPIIVDGPVKVDEGDVLAYLLRVPEEQRGTFRTSYDRVATVADGVYIARSFAQRARAGGLDKDPLVQRRLRQAEDSVLADAYADQLRDKVSTVKLETRAKELYQADPDAYRVPETLSVQHILVDLRGRTREQARERADELYKRAAAGEDFLMLAGRYSDDPMKTRNGGTFDTAPAEAFDSRWRPVLEKLQKGQVAAPFESDDGFHIFRMADRQPAHLATYEEVRERIIKAERDRLAKQEIDQVVQEIRSSPTVVTHRDNLEALVIPVDEKKLNKAQEEAEKRLEEERRSARERGQK
jgi:peptidyl-prolyl cis-trans isomerase C